MASLSPELAAAASKFTMHFVTSIREVLHVMVGLPVTIGSPRLKTDPTATYDVSGIIGFSGGFEGSMVLSFKMEAATKIVAGLIGSEVPPTSPDFADAVGELANVIAGSAKKNLGGTNISIPNVVIGVGHIIARMQDVPCIVIPCETRNGPFAVEVNIKPVHLAPKPTSKNISPYMNAGV